MEDATTSPQGGAITAVEDVTADSGVDVDELKKMSASQHTLNETFESLTPYEPDEPPPIEQVETPTPIKGIEQSKIKHTLSALASPFKSSKGFHLGPMKTKKFEDGEIGEVTNKQEKKKKSKKNAVADADVDGVLSDDDEGKKKKKAKKSSRAGSLVKRLGSLGSSNKGKQEGAKVGGGGGSVEDRRQSEASSGATPDSVKRRTPDGEHDESGSQYASVEDMPVAPLAEADTISDDPPPEVVVEDIPSIATTHPVSTLPFAVSTWKPKNKAAKEHVIEKPIEQPGPEDALRKRISFEDAGDDAEPGSEPPSPPGGKLSRMVELARRQLSVEHTSPPPRSRSTSPIPPPTRIEERDVEVEDDDDDEGDERFEDTEAGRLEGGEGERGMSPYGDIIEGPDTEQRQQQQGQEQQQEGAMGANQASNPSTIGSDRREHLYKILVIGELGTGKTSIIKRYVHQFFSQHYRATIGVDFALKVLNWDANTTVRLQLWDIAGQERFGNMTRVYYKEAVGAFVVFDVTRVATFDAVVKWKQDLDSKVQLPDGSPIPCVLLANKCDQQKEGIVNNQAKMDEYCKEKGFAAWYETSAKENINIEEAARALVNRILYNDKFAASADSKDSAGFPLDGGRNASVSSSGSKCAC